MQNVLRTTTSAEFAHTVLGSDTPAIVDFYSPGCGPCRLLKRELAKLAETYPGIKVVTVDIAEWPDLAQRYLVRSVPTVLAFRDGQIVAQQVGFSRASRVAEMFAELTGRTP